MKERKKQEQEQEENTRSIVSRYTTYAFAYSFHIHIPYAHTLLYSHIIYSFTFHIVLLFTQIHFSQLAKDREICRLIARNGFLGYSQNPPSERQPLFGNSGHRPASVNHWG